MVSEKFSRMVLKNKDLLRKYLESRKTGGREMDSDDELTETEDIEEVVDSDDDIEDDSDAALTSKLVRTSMPNILEDGSPTSARKSQPGAGAGTRITQSRTLFLRPSKSLPSISPHKQVGDSNSNEHYPSLPLPPLPHVTFRVDDDEMHEPRETANDSDNDNGNNTETESETDTTDSDRSDSDVLLIPAEENRSTEENISKTKKKVQLFPFPEHVSLLDTIFKVIRVQVHPPPLEKPLLQTTVPKRSTSCSPEVEVTEVPGPSSSSFGLAQCHDDTATMSVADSTILTAFSEEVTSTTTEVEETIIIGAGAGIKMDELKHMQEPDGGAYFQDQDHSTRSSSFAILSISSTAAKTPSPKSGNGFFFRLFKKTKSKSESKLTTIKVTTDTDKEDAEPDLDELTNSTSSHKKSAKTNKKGKDKESKPAVGKVHEVPIKIEVVGYFDDTNFTTMKLSNSMKVWLCDKPTDILVIKENGSMIDSKQASECRKTRKSKKSHCHSHRSSPAKSIKSSFVKIYDHLFTKKDKDLNSLSEELTQKLVTSSSLEGLEIKISASDTDPELSSNSGPGSGSNSHSAADPVPGPSTSYSSTSCSTRKNKQFSLSSYEIVDVQEKNPNQD